MSMPALSLCRLKREIQAHRRLILYPIYVTRSHDDRPAGPLLGAAHVRGRPLNCHRDPELSFAYWSIRREHQRRNDVLSRHDGKFVAKLFADRRCPGTCCVIRDLLRRREYENFYVTLALRF